MTKSRHLTAWARSRSAAFVLSGVVVILSLGCSRAAPVAGAPTEIPLPSPTPDLAAELPFEGLWWSEDGKVLVLTPASFYTHENEQDYDRQVFGEVQKIDLEQGLVEYRMRAIYINGEPAGFDDPMKYLTYTREGDTLRVSSGSQGYPTVFDETFTRR